MKISEEEVEEVRVEKECCRESKGEVGEREREEEKRKKMNWLLEKKGSVAYSETSGQLTPFCREERQGPPSGDPKRGKEASGRKRSTESPRFSRTTTTTTTTIPLFLVSVM